MTGTLFELHAVLCVHWAVSSLCRLPSAVCHERAGSIKSASVFRLEQLLYHSQLKLNLLDLLFLHVTPFSIPAVIELDGKLYRMFLHFSANIRFTVHTMSRSELYAQS